MTLSEIEQALGQPSVAEEVLRNAAGRSPGADADLALARLYLGEDRNSDAEKLFRTVVQLDPKNAEALLGLAVVQLQEGKMGNAEKTYGQVSSIPNDKHRPLHGDFAGARTHAHLVLGRQPGNVRALDILAGTYTAQKQMAAALEAVRQYAANQPSNLPVPQFYGQMLAARGDLDQSRALFDRLRNQPGAAMNSEFALAQIGSRNTSSTTLAGV